MTARPSRRPSRSRSLSVSQNPCNPLVFNRFHTPHAYISRKSFIHIYLQTGYGGAYPAELSSGFSMAYALTISEKLRNFQRAVACKHIRSAVCVPAHAPRQPIFLSRHIFPKRFSRLHTSSPFCWYHPAIIAATTPRHRRSHTWIVERS